MRALIFMILVQFTSYAFGHGESKPGPNGGHIRMPGQFHLELVPGDDTSFKMYLLDIDWKNPTVTNSKLEVVVKSGKKQGVVGCKAGEVSFECTLPKGFSLKSGRLMVKSSREGVNGAQMEYHLPLKFADEGSNSEHSGHSAH